MIPAETTARWRALDTRHHLHPFTHYRDLAARGSRIITRAEGCYLFDSEGNRILDGMAGLWCVNVGYGRERLADAAYRQMRELPFYNTFFQCATPPAVELAAKLAQITPAGLDRIFFTNSGSEANDTVAKLVRYFWNLEGRPEKKVIVSRRYGYYGVTLATASMSGLATMHPQGDLPLPGFVHTEAPYWYVHGGDLDPEAFGLEAARALERTILDVGPERVAAFIGEPVQGAGGVIIPPASYWPEVQRVCREHDVLLVADEVVCGFGRLGGAFGSFVYGIEPDLMTMAKGLSSGYQPIAAVALGRRVGDAVFGSAEEFFHGFTYSGHPVACAVALENIAIMEEEGLLERAGGPLGEHFARALGTLADHPLVGEVRTEGLIGAVELVQDRARRRCFDPLRKVGLICREHCIEGGLVMRAIRDVMVLSPPLVITEAEIDEAVTIARRAFDLTLDEVVG